MENENKFKKGTFEKIDEDNYKVNGNFIKFSEKELIPIVRDIVECREIVAIEKYNLSKTTYPIGEKDVPVSELITEIPIFLNSLLIRRKTLKNGICYYEIEDKVLSVEHELALLVENIMDGVHVNIADYKLKKESYLINNTVIPLAELASTIRVISPIKLNDSKVGDHLYNIDDQIIYIEDELVPIIEDIFNYKELVTGIEKEIYQFRFLKFVLNLPDSIKRTFSKQQMKCNEFNIYKIEEAFSELPDDAKIEQFVNFIKVVFKLTSVNQALNLFYPDCFSFSDKELINNEYNNKHIDSFVDWFICQYDSMIEKWYKKNFNGSTISYQKYVTDRLKGNCILVQQLDEYLSVLNSADPSSFVKYPVTVVRHFENEYRDWEENIFNKGEFSLDYITSLDYQWTKEAFFIHYHNYCQNNFLYIFFSMLNENSLTGAEYKYIIEKLKDIGLDEFVQKEYDEYRKVTGGGKDFCFYELEVKDLIIPQTPIIHNENAEKEIFNVLRKPLDMGESGLRYLYNKLYKQFLDAATDELNFITCLGADNNKEHLKKIKWIGKVFELKYFLDILYKDEGYSYIDAAKIFIQKNGKSLSERSLKNDTKNVPKNGVCYMFRRLIKEALEIE